MANILMCRICLSENVRMHPIANTDLHYMYEKLSEYAFVKESRPLLVCYICHVRLKHCHELMIKCHQSEEILTKMCCGIMHDRQYIDAQLSWFNTWVVTPGEPVSIIEEPTTGHLLHVKEEPDGDHDDVELKVEFEIDDEPLEGTSHSYEDQLSDPEDDIPLQSMSQALSVARREGYGADNTGSKEQFYTAKKCKLEVNSTNVYNPGVNAAGDMYPKHIKVEHTKMFKNNTVGTCQFSRGEIESQETKIPSDNFQTSSKEQFICDICNSSFQYKSTIISHIRSHSVSKRHKCNICQTTFRDIYHLNKHKRVHTGDKPHKCKVCNASFTYSSNLLCHLRVHTGDKPYKCHLCHKSFTGSTNLRAHLRVHRGERPFKCDICEGTYTQKAHLKSHMRKHTGDKPFKCNVCYIRFSSRSTFMKHCRLHEKPYECHLCDSRFMKKRELKTHIRMHGGERPYKCQLCPAAFKKKSPLNRHLRVHTGERPFTCDICQCSFSVKSNLGKHIRIHYRVGVKKNAKLKPDVVVLSE